MHGINIKLNYEREFIGSIETLYHVGTGKSDLIALYSSHIGREGIKSRTTFYHSQTEGIKSGTTFHHTWKEDIKSSTAVIRKRRVSILAQSI
jgi:hypothetical protein